MAMEVPVEVPIEVTVEVPIEVPVEVLADESTEHQEEGPQEKSPLPHTSPSSIGRVKKPDSKNESKSTELTAEELQRFARIMKRKRRLEAKRKKELLDDAAEESENDKENQGSDSSSEEIYDADIEAFLDRSEAGGDHTDIAVLVRQQIAEDDERRYQEMFTMKGVRRRRERRRNNPLETGENMTRRQKQRADLADDGSDAASWETWSSTSDDESELGEDGMPMASRAQRSWQVSRQQARTAERPVEDSLLQEMQRMPLEALRARLKVAVAQSSKVSATRKAREKQSTVIVGLSD